MKDSLVRPRITAVEVESRSPDVFASILGRSGHRRFAKDMTALRDLLDGRCLYQVNSTARGGGVAEMLHSLVPYLRGSGVRCEWLVIEGNEDFFGVTKRLHNNLHGEAGDGGPLGDAEKGTYERVLDGAAAELASFLDPGDVVLLHDPQTAGLVRAIREAGAAAIWRCHVGVDHPNHLTRRAWEFLRHHVTEADAYVYSRPSFAWEGLEQGKTWVIPPSIDAFSPKNRHLDAGAVGAILEAAGLLDASPQGPAVFTRGDGTPGLLRLRADMVEGNPPPPASARLVLQVSRWDRLKDPLGVMEGFARHVRQSDAHLVLAGPAVEGVDDDPEGAQVLWEALALWRGLPRRARNRIHLAALPVDDLEENAIVVNALQRRADVVVQKSLAEGFGLTVAEAMWKGRAVVASRVGGIQDQIVGGATGLLIDDPADLAAFGEAVVRLLNEPWTAARLGEKARRYAARRLLHSRQLVQHVAPIAAAWSRRFEPSPARTA